MEVTSKRWDARLGVWVLDDSEEKAKKLEEAEKEEKTKKAVLDAAKEKNEKKAGNGDVRDTGHYYDAKLNAWVDIATGIVIPHDEVKDTSTEATLQSCELHPSQKVDKKPDDKKETEHSKFCICQKCKPVAIRDHTTGCQCFQCWQWKKEKGITTETNWPGYSNHYNTNSYSNYNTSPYGSNWKPCMPWEGLKYEKWPNTFMFLLSYYWVGNRWYEGRHISDADYRERIINGVYKPEAKARPWSHEEGDYDGA